MLDVPVSSDVRRIGEQLKHLLCAKRRPRFL